MANRFRINPLYLLLVFLWGLQPLPLEAAWEKNVILVELERGGATLEKIYKKVGRPTVTPLFRKGGRTPLARFYKLSFPQNIPDFDFLSLLLLKIPGIKTVSPNFLLELETIPDDPYFLSSSSWGQGIRDMWGLEIIGAPEAWEITTGDPDLMIAVVDSGLDLDHPDIVGNVFSNLSEQTGSTGVDDDGNGYQDDIHGYDFVSEDGDPSDDHGHGTHVAGTIAAVGDNGSGIVGVLWSGKILSVKACSADARCPSDLVANAVVYAVDQGASIINLSLGGVGRVPALEEAVEYAHSNGVVIVAAAGNSRTNAAFHFPSSYPGAISVAASTSLDQRASFSNYGVEIDVAAPGGGEAADVDSGRSILSLRAEGTDMYGGGIQIVGSNYYRARGTSMASPHVTGAVGLLLSHDPSLTPEEIRQRLRMSAEDIEETGWDLEVGYGRLNLPRTLLEQPTCEAVISSPQNYAILREDEVMIEGQVGGRDFSRFTLEWGRGMSAVEWVTIAEGAAPIAEGLIGELSLDPSQIGGQSLRLRVYDDEGRLCGEERRFFQYAPLRARVSIREAISEQRLGFSLAAGDLDHDGKADLLIGAPSCESPYQCSSMTNEDGEVYLVYGGTSGLGHDVSVGDVTLFPVSWRDDASHRLGVSLEIADINGDSYGDILMGIPGAADNGVFSGKICLFLGGARSSSTWTREMSLTTADYCFYGEEAGDRLGYHLTTGDFDGDGARDIATSACGHDEAGSDFGKVYIIYGRDRSSWGVSAGIEGSSGTSLTGTASISFRCSDSYFGEGIDISRAGDFNGDGIDDLVIGNPVTIQERTYLFLGNRSGIPSGSFSDATLILESSAYDYFGITALGVGDMNGDGLDEIMVGSDGLFVFGVLGAAHLFLGDSTLTGIYDYTELPHAVFSTISSFDRGGRVIQRLGDLNEDGLDDIALGASGSDLLGGFSSGIAYVRLGSPSFSSDIFPHIASYVLKDGEEESILSRPTQFGRSIVSGDFDGDGDLDIAVSAAGDHSTVYLFFPADRCGDGVIDFQEGCDDGNTLDGDGCSSSCQTEAICGDGLLSEGEECDDGNTELEACVYGLTSCDVCDSTCHLRSGETSFCGDGELDSLQGEECDNGALNNDSLPDACRANCQSARCGDSVRDSGERCDDGNRDDRDGCTVTCWSCIGRGQPAGVFGIPGQECCPGLELNRTGLYCTEPTSWRFLEIPVDFLRRFKFFRPLP
ncbi:MAG: S8 family serine peptidase [Deltaproteobacteria bacterium]|nr:S8 family serine peptidase [Deltaproteobacteria bacterium]